MTLHLLCLCFFLCWYRAHGGILGRSLISVFPGLALTEPDSRNLASLLAANLYFQYYTFSSYSIFNILPSFSLFLFSKLSILLFLCLLKVTF